MNYLTSTNDIKMSGKFPDFYKQHNEYQAFIELFLLDWDEKVRDGVWRRYESILQ